MQLGTTPGFDGPHTSSKRYLKLVAGLFFLVFLIWAQAERLGKPGSRGLLVWDSAGYYAYLPAAFIYHDITFGFHQEAAGIPRDQFGREVEGIFLNRYPLGPAMMQSPFFLGAHLIAANGTNVANGYSTPYRWGILIGAAFYSALGLFFLGLVLMRYFPLFAVILTQIILGIGTNLLHYTTNEGMMSHVYSFFLFAVTLWATVQWREEKKSFYVFIIALLAGLIAVTRLSNLLFLLVPFLWGFKSIDDWKSLFRPFLNLGWRIVLLPILFLLPFIPQSLYLLEASGQWWRDTYAEETFFWQDPMLFKVLMSYRKGWLVYSPLLILGFIGWWKLRNHPGFYAMTIFWLLNLYVVSSWWCWWYGGGFGMRALIESSVVVSFGIAWVITWLGQRQIASYALAVLLPWFIGLNILQTHQYGRGIIHWDAMSNKSYWAVFGLVHPVHQSAMDQRDKHLVPMDYGLAGKDRQYRRTR